MEGWDCRNANCQFKNNRYRTHGFCCNACKIGLEYGAEYHTQNCMGGKNYPIEPFIDRWADPIEPFEDRSAHRGQKRPRPHVSSCVAFQVPEHWMRGSEVCVSGWVEWYETIKHEELEPFAKWEKSFAEWKKLDRFLEFHWNSVQFARMLTIYVHGQEEFYGNRSEDSPLDYIDVNQDDRIVPFTSRMPEHALNTDQKQFGNCFNPSNVTGLDTIIQAVLVRQPNMVQVIRDAVTLIEKKNLSSFTFVCRSGTHRSPACAFFLAALVYNQAHVVFSKRRTINAARTFGMKQTWTH